jgi:hypothetical protein
MRDDTATKTSERDSIAGNSFANNSVATICFWRAVILRSVRQCISGVLRRSLETGRYLLGDRIEFAYALESAERNRCRLHYRRLRLKR